MTFTQDGPDAAANIDTYNDGGDQRNTTSTQTMHDVVANGNLPTVIQVAA
jgi:hypothetical protein